MKFTRSGPFYRVDDTWYQDYARGEEIISVSYRGLDTKRKPAKEVFDKILKGLNS